MEKKQTYIHVDTIISDRNLKLNNLAAIKINRELSGTHSVITMPLMTKIATSEVLHFSFDDGNI